LSKAAQAGERLRQSSPSSSLSSWKGEGQRSDDDAEDDGELRSRREGAGQGRPHPERAAIEFPLAAAHRALGDHARAARHYARGLKLLPNFAEGSKWLDGIAPNYPFDDF